MEVQIIDGIMADILKMIANLFYIILGYLLTFYRAIIPMSRKDIRGKVLYLSIIK